MKTLKLIVFGMMMTLAFSLQGQLSVRVNVGTPPSWGPSGFNNERYYYLPDIETYYDVQNSSFIYFSGNRWIHSRALPARYRNYDLYGGYKVVMNGYRGNTPYLHFNDYRNRYGKGYRGREQHNIGERHDNRGMGREAIRPNRSNDRGPDRNHNQVQYRGNDKGHDQGKNRDQGHGNDNKKDDGHDNGNRK